VESESLWIENERSEAEYAAQVDWKAGWHFVRLLKGHPELKKLDCRSALRRVKRCFDELENGGWSYYDETSQDEGILMLLFVSAGPQSDFFLEKTISTPLSDWRTFIL